MKKHRYLFIFSLIVCLLGIAFVFSNSLQDSPTSHAYSNRVADFLRPWLDPDGTDDKFHEHIRKLAHGVEFCFLGCCFGILMRWFQRRYGRYHIAMCLFLLLSIAVTDEFIQSFTGRTSSVRDVLIDFGGGLIGWALSFLPIWLRKIFGRTPSEHSTNPVNESENRP